VRDKESRSGIARNVRIWSVISGGRELSSGMIVGGEEVEDSSWMYRRQGDSGKPLMNQFRDRVIWRLGEVKRDLVPGRGSSSHTNDAFVVGQGPEGHAALVRWMADHCGLQVPDSTGLMGDC
jgi:hypothetical protein